VILVAHVLYDKKRRRQNALAPENIALDAEHPPPTDERIALVPEDPPCADPGRIHDVQ